MHVEILTLCDFAQESGGKLTVVGAFDQIRASEFPVTHPMCAIAARLRFGLSEEGSHAVRIALIDADGAQILDPMTVRFDIRIPRNLDSAAVNLVATVGQLHLERFGAYSLELTVDDAHAASAPFYAVED